jgi:hypothetical protein
MSVQTTQSRKINYGWWISIIAIGIIAALQIGVIIDAVITGRAPSAQ